MNRSALFHRGFPVCVLLGAFLSVWAGENSDVHAAFVVMTLNAPVTSIKLILKAGPSHTHTSAPRLDCCIFGHCQSTVNTGHYRSPVPATPLLRMGRSRTPPSLPHLLGYQGFITEVAYCSTGLPRRLSYQPIKIPDNILRTDRRRQ